MEMPLHEQGLAAQPHSPLLAPFLQAAQAARLFPDSKTLVDMPLAAPPEELAAAFDALELPDALTHAQQHHDALAQFCQQWLLPLESDLLPVPLAQLGESPPSGWLPLVPQPEIRQWAEHLYQMWGSLCRQAAPDVAAHPDRHTLLPTGHAFVIPGARFREMYYWDTFWVLRGLLTCGMSELAKGILSNMLEVVERHGYMPNGMRTYYLNRSQPPLLSQMVAAVHAACPDRTLLQRALQALLKEHAYWTSGPKQVVIEQSGGQRHQLSRYFAAWDQPRPESYREDVATAAGLDAEAARKLWRQLASAAESGWDFSSRWMAGGSSLRACCTTGVVPADLNAFVYQMECNISQFATELGDAELVRAFAQHAQQRLAAINALLWDEGSSQWRDLELDLKEESAAGKAADGAGRLPAAAAAALAGSSSRAGQQRQAAAGAAETGPGPGLDQACSSSSSSSFRQSKVVAASNWVPLYCGCAPAGSMQAAAAVASLQRSGLIQAAGVAVSLSQTGQQWDWSNSWPPITCMLLEGCRYGDEHGAQLAATLAQQYLQTAHAAWQQSGRMFEKFDALHQGAPGGGGEYECVDGFGWTNGVALLLLEAYGWQPAALDALRPVVA